MPDLDLIKGSAMPRRQRRRDNAALKWRIANLSVPGHCVQCRAPLPPRAATGRRRVTCSDACRRAFDKRWKKIRSRLISLRLWREELSRGRYRRAAIRLRLRELRAEIFILKHQR
jgi:predicted nucleic acid-binding Zn ribbon protein